MGVAVAARARAKNKAQKLQFLSRIHRLRSCGASGVKGQEGRECAPHSYRQMPGVI